MNKKVKQVISVMAVLGCVVIGSTSCGKKDPNSPGVEYMPDMYRSPSLETNMGYVMHNGDTIQVNRLPVSGTIARGFMPYPYPNTQEGYEAAGMNLHNPLEVNAKNEADGEVLYGKFCVHCHGAGGEADGPVAKKLSGPPPSYKSPQLMGLPEGKMFHSITYGKGLMGAHAPLLSKEEIWKVIMHIHKLQYPNGMPSATAAADSAAAKKTEVKK
jgi:mono/diheme cytochrome c family protein